METKGFGIFKDKAQLRLLRRAAQARGLIVLTDSDGAGFVIRNYLRGVLPPERVKHAYIPDVPGKERRKAAPGKQWNGRWIWEYFQPAFLFDCIFSAGHWGNGIDRYRRGW